MRIGERTPARRTEKYAVREFAGTSVLSGLRERGR
jgi:hypothetical protein